MGSFRSWDPEKHPRAVDSLRPRVPAYETEVLAPSVATGTIHPRRKTFCAFSYITRKEKGRLATVFPSGDAATILGVLDLYDTESCEREQERVQLALVALSEGREDKLLYFVQIAKADYRDILYWVASGPLSEEQGAKQISFPAA